MRNFNSRDMDTAACIMGHICLKPHLQMFRYNLCNGFYSLFLKILDDLNMEDLVRNVVIIILLCYRCIGNVLRL